FRVLSESGIASGVRRIEAVTGAGALDAIAHTEAQLDAICEVVKAGREGVAARVSALRSENRELEKELARLKQKLATSAGGDLTSQAVDVAGIKVLAASVDGADAKSLRDTLDQ
ncbi:MAG: DHHA1 domain-containing protein, partial [Haliea sp.]|nr:DHHA1 domain-containing protein [Haliea sp.]